MKRIIIMVLCLSVLVFLISCSNGRNPVEPSLSDDMVASENVSGTNPESSDANNPNYGMFGIWNVRIDLQSMTAEVIPPRDAKAIGHIFDADLSQFLTVSPCSNCLSIPAVGYDGYKNLLVKVRMKHPFGDIAKRPDLHGFDVRAIFVLPSTMTASNLKVMNPSAVEEDASYSWNLLLNPDGYTSHYDWLVSDSRYFMGGPSVQGNLNPFIRFFESYSTGAFDPNAPSGWNVMPVGATHSDKIVVFNSDNITTALEFYVIADVAYGQSAVLANRTSPQYYLPAFNRTEPWRAEYWIENNNLAWIDPASTADLVVQVFDWQHNATVDTSYPNPANLSGIPEKSGVLRLELSVPVLQDAPVVVTTPESGDGSPTNPLQYRMTVTNQNTWSGTAYGLLAIRDDLYGQASPHGRMPVPLSPAGFPYATSDILDYTIYIPIYINMPSPGMVMSFGTFFGEFEGYIPFGNQFAHQYGGPSDIRTQFYPKFFMDPSMRKFQYRWDYDYDGVTFDIDGSGCPSPEVVFTSPGKKNVGFRVRTNTVPPQEYLYEFPVYAEGTAFRNQPLFMAATRNTTSSRRSHAVDITKDYFYMVFSREESGNRDIWLALTDRAGEITMKKITTSPNVDFNPVIEVVEQGSHAGVYIVFSSYDGADAFLYSTYGNLDGTGFEPSHLKRVTTVTGAAELEPVLIDEFGQLNCYYTIYAFVAAAIFGAHSTDYGQTWIEDNRVVDNGSIGQLNSTVTWHSYSKLALVWEDYLNSTDRGSDIWFAESSDGVTFTGMKNISSFNDKTYEFSPSSSSFNDRVVIAYLVAPDTSSPKQIRLKYYRSYDNTIYDQPITPGFTTGRSQTQPSVAVGGDGSCILSYGSYNTSSYGLDVYVLKIYQSPDIGTTYAYSLFKEYVGTSSANNYGFEAWPCVATYSPIPNVTEAFVAFRNYEGGFYESALTPKEVFGEIDVTYIITESDLFYF